LIKELSYGTDLDIDRLVRKGFNLGDLEGDQGWWEGPL
jgi:hypothetical protein